MESGSLIEYARPKLRDGRMILAFTGWMDGGDVSTGTVDWLIEQLGAKRIAEIDPEPYYLYNLPGSMEVSALFRPHVRLEDGLIQQYERPESTFFCDQANRLILFRGKEPNLNWQAYADDLFTLASSAGVSTIWFIGSFSGMVPHTREPRMSTVVSDESMLAELTEFGLRPGTYEGPASFATCMIHQAAARGFRMASLVAEIPPYIEGTNPRCIEAVLRKLLGLLDLPLDIEPMRETANAWEQRVSQAADDKDELDELVAKLEAAYDSEVFDNELGDLKAWLQRQGLQVD